MSHDENEMMIEYSEMTAFNFNSKEYQEVKKDFIDLLVLEKQPDNIKNIGI